MPPFGFGISTPSTTRGLYRPSSSAFPICCQPLPYRNSPSSSTVIPSTPGAPLLLLTSPRLLDILGSQHLLHGHRRDHVLPCSGVLVPRRGRLVRVPIPPSDSLARVERSFRHLSHLSAPPSTIESDAPVLLASRSPLAGFPPPMAPADFWRSNSPSGENARSPGVRRVTFLPSTRRIYMTPLRMTFGFRCPTPPRPGSACLVCDSCSSGREFAYSFLQTPPRGGRPCCSARSSRHQGLQRTFTSKSLPGSVSLTGSQATCTVHVASRHARRT